MESSVIDRTNGTPMGTGLCLAVGVAVGDCTRRAEEKVGDLGEDAGMSIPLGEAPEVGERGASIIGIEWTAGSRVRSEAATRASA